jgi:hypothetical protein
MLDQSTPAVLDRLIGRVHETTSVAAALDSIAEARATALVLSGDAGSGKSMLLDWAARAAARRDFTVISATGVEFEQGLAFSGLSAVLHPLLPSSTNSTTPTPARCAVRSAWVRPTAAC